MAPKQGWLEVWSLSLSAWQLLGLAAMLLAMNFSLIFIVGVGAHFGIFLFKKPRRSLADAVTAGRLALVMAVTFWVETQGHLPLWAWVLLLMALLMDGLDGWLARRLQQASSEGAIFDMEADAVTLTLLTGLVLKQGELGPWILILAAWRPFYCFLTQVLVEPQLHPRGHFWGKAVFVLTAGSLLNALHPWPPSLFKLSVAMLACSCLTASFMYSIAQCHRLSH